MINYCQHQPKKCKLAPLIAIYVVLFGFCIYQVSQTLICTAQMIKYRSLSVATNRKQTKLDSEINELRSKLAVKKSMNKILASKIDSFNTPMNIYISLTSSNTVANLEP